VKVEEEAVLAVTKFPVSMKMLSDPNMWVGDNAACVHMSPHDNLMSMDTKRETSETITIGNRESEKTA
jgi:hypothetical protein